jgi:hypothetical protein
MEQMALSRHHRFEVDLRLANPVIAWSPVGRWPTATMRPHS